MLSWDYTLKPSGGGFAPYSRTISGGPSLGDFEQVINPQVQRWRATFQFNIRTRAQINALRALLINLEGRTGSIAVPVFGARPPWEIDAYGREINPKFARTRALDDTPYADGDDFNSTLIVAETADDASLRDDRISIRLTRGSPLQPGQYFSKDRQLHAIRQIFSVEGGVTRARIWPLLRDDIEDGSSLNFYAPTCAMRFIDDGQGVDLLSGLDLFKFGTVSLSFEEVPQIQSIELREDGGIEFREDGDVELRE